MESYSGKVVIQQRVLPSYRASLFEEIADRCPNGFSLFVGEPREEEAIKTATSLTSGRLVKADNQHFFRGKYYFCKQKGFVEMLEDFQPDALIIEANPRNISTPSAINWMHAHGKKVSGWGLGAPPINGLFTNFRKNRRQKLYASLDSIVSYSQRGADEYRSMGFPKNKIFVAYNAAAPAPKGSLPKKPIQFNGPPAILFVGRLQSRKRLDLLFKACAAQKDSPKLIIVGDGPAKTEAVAQAQAEYPAAIFVGAKHGKDLAEYYQQADLFVLPGTGGLAIQQAMANGLPVIVAQGDGTQDDLVRPENGWLLPPNDLDSLTNTLSDALSDAGRLRVMGKESYRITKEEINLDKMVDVFINMLNQTHKVK
ncbi:MAG: glycosyltransferase [Chloroflexi bacterium]|jgi:glycosyltransferase involved in cell wall biosynthesis|nr:glycosyltransferase [Chloroflexota bacterium]MBT3670564.1 glycosyltransferase [Chloroflexota bacterium]MBT4002390.1 glycosyltransferase [Chloroflexota bacterium]MBT4304199.1 glycosyltransferase [Chloroflexota bacterium]MBT4533442.1 glycosyltransferase [Chloroflexota bacterium]